MEARILEIRHPEKAIIHKLQLQDSEAEIEVQGVIIKTNNTFRLMKILLLHQ
jgi:hypothetical protein